MARVPRLDSPCPLPPGARPVNGGHCSHCNATVHCLDGHDTAAREALLASATGPLCVSYRVRTRIAIAATLVSASAAAFAGDPLLPERVESPVNSDMLERIEVVGGGITRPADAVWTPDASEASGGLDHVMVGGITRPDDATWHDDADIATLPVVSADAAETALDAEPDVR